MKFRREFFVREPRQVADEIGDQPGQAQEQQRQPGFSLQGGQAETDPQGQPGQDEQQANIIAEAQDFFHGHLHFLNSNMERVRYSPRKMKDR